MRLLLSCTCVVAICLAPTQTVAQAKAPTYYTWTTSPSLLTAGSKVDVILTAPSDECKVASFDATLQKATVVVQTGLNVTATSAQHSGNCEMTVTLKADTTVTQGSLRVTILDGSAPPAQIGQGTITLAAMGPGPVPPGVQGVDAIWQVEDYNVIKQNFGQNLANRYLGILVKLGNNTGYNLILDGIAFETLSQPLPPCSASPDCQMPNPVPSETPILLQGVVAYGQNYSARNIAVRSLQWASLLTTGFIPFFKAAHAAANYSSAIALFNGPFTSGFSQQFPDLTVQQLQRLGGNGILGNSNELDNNSSAAYLAFLSRTSLCDGTSGGNPSVVDLKVACGQTEAKSMNPALLTKYLAELVLVGVKIPAANARFRVVANSTAAASTELTADKSVTAGVATATTISSPANSGLDLTGATVVQPNEAGVTVSGTTKTNLQASITAHTTKTNFALQFLLKDGTTVGATVNVAVPVITGTVAGGNITFSCDQCSVTDKSSDWNSSINLTWSDQKLTINAAVAGAGFTLPALTTSEPLGKTPTGKYPVHLIPKNFVSGDQGVAVQVTVP